MTEFVAPYTFMVTQRKNEPAVPIEIEASCEKEAYRLCLAFAGTIGFQLASGALGKNDGAQQLEKIMFYEPRRGWYFGDDRDTVPF